MRSLRNASFRTGGRNKSSLLPVPSISEVLVWMFNLYTLKDTKRKFSLMILIISILSFLFFFFPMENPVLLWYYQYIIEENGSSNAQAHHHSCYSRGHIICKWCKTGTFLWDPKQNSPSTKLLPIHTHVCCTNTHTPVAFKSLYISIVMLIHME